MDKDEILKKSRQENRNGDERVKLESDKASTFGMVGMALVFFALFLIRFFLGTGRRPMTCLRCFSAFSLSVEFTGRSN